MSMQGTSGFVVETSALTKRFGDRVAVDNVELRVPRGSAFGYLGPNGAGKTTLIRMLLGLTKATGGTMRLLGRPVPDERAAALARVGAIVEEPRFHKHLTGRENLTVIAAAREPEAHDRIDGALARVGLSQRADERVKRYSLGMRQRLGVARSLLADPELLILDEPTNGLDPAGIHEFRDMIRGFVAEGRTVLLSSHLLDEVEKICDEVAIVDRGKVVVQGSIAELAAGGKQTILIATSDEEQALAILSDHRGVKSAIAEANGIRITLSAHSVEAQDDISRRLVLAGLAIRRFEPARVSLEQRFLEITSRLEECSMSSTTVIATAPRTRARRSWRPRLVSAEFLKLRKRRGLVISTLALTVLPMIAGYTVLLSIHAANPAKHGPAGGLENLSGSMDMLSTLSVVAAILVGATLGAGDLGSGVFRELVVTGRSRLALFAARIPAGLMLLLPIVGAGYAITATGSVVFAGYLGAPSASLLIGSAAWLGLVASLALVLALGVSSTVGSRGTTIGIVLGWQVVAAPVLLQIKTLGSLREGLVGAATDRVAPAALFEGSPKVSISIAAAVLVIAMWTVIPLAIGAWRTCTRDA